MSINKRKIWGSLFVGIVLLIFACYIYVDLTHWETYGGTKRMPTLLLGLYNLLGVWGVSGFFVLVGGGLVARGIWYMKKTDNTEQVE